MSDRRDNLINAVAIGPTSVTATSLADVGEDYVVYHEYVQLNCQVENATGAATLTDFAVMVQPVEGGDWFSLMSGADWDAEDIQIKPFVSDTGLNTLAADGLISFRLQIGGVYAVKFQASVAAGTGSLTIQGVFTRNA